LPDGQVILACLKAEPAEIHPRFFRGTDITASVPDIAKAEISRYLRIPAAIEAAKKSGQGKGTQPYVTLAGAGDSMDQGAVIHQ
jgi:hypothetical protein